MLENLGQKAIEAGKDLIKRAEEHEEAVNPKLTPEERNELFLKHEDALKSKNHFSKGDIVKLAPSAELIEIEGEEANPEDGILMLVVEAGKEAQRLTADFGRDMIVKFVNNEGKIRVLALGSCYFEKVRSFNQKK